MNVALIGHGRLGKLLSKYLGQDFKLNILEHKKTREELDGLKSSQLVILCVPISAMPDTLEEIKNYLSPGTLVMDTCSVMAD